MNDRIANALNTGGNYDQAFTNLCTIGAANYSQRITTVRNTINKLLADGTFKKKYDRVTNSFVDF
jgi:hypothetical protein